MNEGTKAGALTLGTNVAAFTFRFENLALMDASAVASGSSSQWSGGGWADITRNFRKMNRKRRCPGFSDDQAMKDCPRLSPSVFFPSVRPSGSSRGVGSDLQKGGYRGRTSKCSRRRREYRPRRVDCELNDGTVSSPPLYVLGSGNRCKTQLQSEAKYLLVTMEK